MENGNRPLNALVYLVGMVGSTVCGTAFVVGGILAGARGLTAVSLAAIVPLAGLLWAILLSAVDRGQDRSRRVAGYRVARDSQPESDVSPFRSGRPLAPGREPIVPLVGPAQNHR